MRRSYTAFRLKRVWHDWFANKPIVKWSFLLPSNHPHALLYSVLGMKRTINLAETDSLSFQLDDKTQQSYLRSGLMIAFETFEECVTSLPAVIDQFPTRPPGSDAPRDIGNKKKITGLYI